LYVTIFEGSGEPMPVPRDSEAYDLWVAQGITKDRIFDGGLKDNFWQMGDTGPCGPCSEIYYDMGPAASDQGHADCAFPCDCGRYVEIWNLVFMQFDRDAGGMLNPLPKPSIDTGMGLERVTAVLQGVISNYETDLFVPLIKRAAELTGRGKITDFTVEVAHEATNKSSAASLRVIADHSRAATFLISDGVLPSNEGRGYVLRKIIRRAITHGRLLGQTKPFLYQMVLGVRDLMQGAYPELRETADRASKVVLADEERFAHTLAIGLEKLDEIIRQTKISPVRVALQKAIDEVSLNPEQSSDVKHLAGVQSDETLLLSYATGAQQPLSFLANVDVSSTARRVLDHRLAEAASVRTELGGADAFKLYDTFGMPLDFIQDAARDQGLGFDQVGFDRAMEEQKTRARASWKGAAKQTANPAYQKLPTSKFEGYWQTRSDGCEVLALIRNGQGVQQLSAGEEGEVILDHTPFYAESGGQVGDQGWFYSDDHNTIVAEVKGCYSPIQAVRAHQVVMKGGTSKTTPNENRVGWAAQHPGDSTLKVGDKVDAVVNTDVREATMRNHTGTHLLHAGLREVLGKHVKQAGSLVAPNHLRFDFSHFAAVEDEELQDIEDIINKEVLRNIRVETLTDVPIDEAINKYHAMALFGEKYGDKVRVVRIGDFSTELCGGTHTAATGEIGLIKILKEGSVSSGVRRVEAITGDGSLRHFREAYATEQEARKWISTDRKGPSPKIEDGDGSINQFMLESHWRLPTALHEEFKAKDAEIKRLGRELDQMRMKSASIGAANIGDKVKEVKGVKVLAHRVDNLERAQMRTLVDHLRDKIGSGVVVLGSASNGNVSLIVGVTKDLTARVQAGKVIGPVAQKVGGKGGGRPDLAEAGGKDAGALDIALDGVYGVVDSLLG
jgi:alanyl-tRNA synthetase